MKFFAKYCAVALLLFLSTMLSAYEFDEEQVMLTLKAKAPDAIKSRVHAASEAALGEECVNMSILSAFDVLCSKNSGLSAKDNIGLYVLCNNKAEYKSIDDLDVSVICAMKVNDNSELKGFLREAKAFLDEADGWLFVSKNEEILQNNDLKKWIVSDINERIKDDVVCSIATSDFNIRILESILNCKNEECPNENAVKLVAMMKELSKIEFSGRCDADKIYIKAKYEAKEGSNLAKTFDVPAVSKTCTYNVLKDEDIVFKANICRNSKNFSHCYAFWPLKCILPLDECDDCNESFEAALKNLNDILYRHSTGDSYLAITNNADLCAFIGVKNNDESIPFVQEMNEFLSQKPFEGLIKDDDQYKNFTIYRTEENNVSLMFNEEVVIFCSVNSEKEKDLAISLIDSYENATSRRCVSISDCMMAEGFTDFARLINATVEKDNFSDTNLRINFIVRAHDNNCTLRADVKNSDINAFITEINKMAREDLSNSEVPDENINNNE